MDDKNPDDVTRYNRKRVLNPATSYTRKKPKAVSEFSQHVKFECSVSQKIPKKKRKKGTEDAIVQKIAKQACVFFSNQHPDFLFVFQRYRKISNEN